MQPAPGAPRPRYFAGLDLAQVHDFTALAVLEKPAAGPDAPAEAAVYQLRHLRRFERHTAYPDIVAGVVAAFAAEPLRGGLLVVDATGVGRPVYDLLLRAKPQARLVPVVITAGHAAQKDEQNYWHVPKKELVAALQLVLQARRLKVSRAIPEAEALARELANFRVKVTAAANETFGAWRDGDHDDLVLAVALALWQAERGAAEYYQAADNPPRTVVDEAPPGAWGRWPGNPW